MRKVIWLQTATEFWLGGGTISLSYALHMGFSDVRQTEIHTAGPLVFDLKALEFYMATGRLKKIAIYGSKPRRFD